MAWHSIAYHVMTCHIMLYVMCQCPNAGVFPSLCLCFWGWVPGCANKNNNVCLFTEATVFPHLFHLSQFRPLFSNISDYIMSIKMSIVCPSMRLEGPSPSQICSSGWARQPPTNIHAKMLKTPCIAFAYPIVVSLLYLPLQFKCTIVLGIHADWMHTPP